MKLAGLQSALAIMCAPTPAIAAPPSAASPEVKALASKEEAAMVALSRWVFVRVGLSSLNCSVEAADFPLLGYSLVVGEHVC